MRIAIFHELHEGGARRAVNEFAKRLKRQHEVDLYVVDEEEEKAEKKFFNKMFFYKFTPKKWVGGNWKVRLCKDTVELYRLRKLHQQIASTINKNNYNLAFIHPSKYTQAPFILRFIKSKKIYYCQEQLRMVYEDHLSKLKLDFPRKLYELFNRFLRKKIDSENLKKADIVLANSYFTKSNVLTAYNIKSKVCYMGVDLSTFKQEELKKDIDVLFMGAKDYINGYPLFLEALQKINRKNVVIKVIDGIRWINDSELVDFYNRSKVILTLGLNEPFGLVALEGMACGVPIIALNEGGYRETVVNNQTGFLVPRDSSIIADRITFLLNDEKKLTGMGVAARKHIENNWTWEKRIKDLESVLMEAKK